MLGGLLDVCLKTQEELPIAQSLPALSGVRSSVLLITTLLEVCRLSGWHPWQVHRSSGGTGWQCRPLLSKANLRVGYVVLLQNILWNVVWKSHALASYVCSKTPGNAHIIVYSPPESRAAWGWPCITDKTVQELSQEILTQAVWLGAYFPGKLHWEFRT